MDERSEELEGPELALLELYREASGPSPEVEDRLLARIQAQVDVEADLADDDDELLGATPVEKARAETRVRPLTAAVIAIVAFAAGVALTWGLRGDVLALDEQRDTPSVSPMTADGKRIHEAPRPSSRQACEVVEVERRVEVPVPVRTDDDDEEAIDDDRDRPETIAVPPSSGWDARDDEPVRDDEGDPILRQRTIAMAPWSGPRSQERGPGTQPRRGASRRPSRGTGIYNPASGLPSRPSKPSAGNTGSSGPGPGSTGGSRGPGTNDGGRGRPGGNDPAGDDGGGPRPPSQPGPDDPPPSSPGDNEPPPPEEPPRDDTPPPPEDDTTPSWQECEEQYGVCYEMLIPWCEQDPQACGEAAYACDLEYQYCIDPWADAWQECDQAVIECYMEADAICLQAGEMVNPDQCMALYEQCELEYVDCVGAFGESEDEPPPAGHMFE